MTKIRALRLSEDIALLVSGNMETYGHIHIAVGLIIPESGGAWILYDFVYHESFKVKMFKWESETRELEAEEEAFFEEVDKLREIEGGR